MRDINEIKAEIFRRSEEIVKKRKKTRNIIIALCITVGISVSALLTAMSSEFMVAKDNAAPPEIYTDVIGSVDGSLFCSYVEVSVTSTGTTQALNRTETDKNRVDAIFEAVTELLGFYYVESNESEPHSGKTSGSGAHKGENYKSESVYSITFYTAEGDKGEYTLSGDKLIDHSNDVEKALSKDEYSKLLEVLGINNGDDAE